MGLAVNVGIEVGVEDAGKFGTWVATEVCVEDRGVVVICVAWAGGMVEGCVSACAGEASAHITDMRLTSTNITASARRDQRNEFWDELRGTVNIKNLLSRMCFSKECELLHISATHQV
jgi:hypothetical protein